MQFDGLDISKYQVKYDHKLKNISYPVDDDTLDCNTQNSQNNVTIMQRQQQAISIVINKQDKIIKFINDITKVLSE